MNGGENANPEVIEIISDAPLPACRYPSRQTRSWRALLLETEPIVHLVRGWYLKRKAEGVHICILLFH